MNINHQSAQAAWNKKKSIVINILLAAVIVIMFLGIYFIFFSLLNKIRFQVLNTSVSGVVFGILVLYLGVKYYFSVIKLKAEIYQENSEFSWNNFKYQNKK